MGRRAEDVNDSLPAGSLTPVVVSTSTPFTNGTPGMSGMTAPMITFARLFTRPIR